MKSEIFIWQVLHLYSYPVHKFGRGPPDIYKLNLLNPKMPDFQGRLQ